MPTNLLNQYWPVHVTLGILSTFAGPSVDAVFILYQVGQLLLNKKVFADKFYMEEGQSADNTFQKISEFYVGKEIANSIRNNYYYQLNKI